MFAKKHQQLSEIIYKIKCGFNFQEMHDLIKNICSLSRFG